MKYFESAYDLPCYNYAKIVTGDIRYLIDDRVSNYPKKLTKNQLNTLTNAFDIITNELPKGQFEKENTLEQTLKIEILELENNVYIFENVERLFYYLDLSQDEEYKSEIKSKIANLGVTTVQQTKTYKNHFINTLKAKKKELNDHLIKLKNDGKMTEFNESDFFNSIMMVSNATSIDLNPKKTSIADFLRRYHLLSEEQRKLKEKENSQKTHG